MPPRTIPAARLWPCVPRATQRRLLASDLVQEAAARVTFDEARAGDIGLLHRPRQCVPRSDLELVLHSGRRVAGVDRNRHVGGSEQMQPPARCKHALRLVQRLDALRRLVDADEDSLEDLRACLHAQIVAAHPRDRIRTIADPVRGKTAGGYQVLLRAVCATRRTRARASTATTRSGSAITGLRSSSATSGRSIARRESRWRRSRRLSAFGAGAPR